MGFWRFQAMISAVSLAAVGIFWPISGIVNPFPTLIFSFAVGNCTVVSLNLSSPLFLRRTPPLDWIVYIVFLVVISSVSSLLASLASQLVFGRYAASLLTIHWPDIRNGTLFSLVMGVPVYLSQKGRGRLEARNRELESQVTRGRMELQTQEAEITAAHEIQAHLLPREIPQVKGFQISCAWQPARSVSGDYFDVLAIAPGQVAVCLADVSGKGLAAALLMANLQAAVRALAPSIADPGALCRKLNELLCDSVAPGKFATLFYGVIDNGTLTMRFENAGHCPPIILRGDEAILLTDGGTVLGLFRAAVYKERSVALQSGDCLLLTTDGVTEAADEGDDEFGTDRMTASARAARSLGAYGIRTRILEDVTQFCKGNFHDDASLMVVTVD
jgi:sigma-B regulation protein RsbU (phosphoserine phosphatase)